MLLSVLPWLISHHPGYKDDYLPKLFGKKYLQTKKIHNFNAFLTGFIFHPLPIIYRFKHSIPQRQHFLMLILLKPIHIRRRRSSIGLPSGHSTHIFNAIFHEMHSLLSEYEYQTPYCRRQRYIDAFIEYSKNPCPGSRTFRNFSTEELLDASTKLKKSGTECKE